MRVTVIGRLAGASRYDRRLAQIITIDNAADVHAGSTVQQFEQVAGCLWKRISLNSALKSVRQSLSASVVGRARTGNEVAGIGYATETNLNRLSALTRTIFLW